MKQPTLWTRDVSSLGQAVWEGAVITTALYRLPTTCGNKIHTQGWPSSLGKPLRVGILMLTSNTLNGNTDGKHSCTVTYTRLLHITIPCSHQEKLGEWVCKPLSCYAENEVVWNQKLNNPHPPDIWWWWHAMPGGTVATSSEGGTYC